MAPAAALILFSLASAEGDPGKCTAPSLQGCFQDPYKTPEGTMRAVLQHKIATGSKNMSEYIAATAAAIAEAASGWKLEGGCGCQCLSYFAKLLFPRCEKHTLLYCKSCLLQLTYMSYVRACVRACVRVLFFGTLDLTCTTPSRHLAVQFTLLQRRVFGWRACWS